jgi:hypothetical protein
MKLNIIAILLLRYVQTIYIKTHRSTSFSNQILQDILSGYAPTTVSNKSQITNIVQYNSKIEPMSFNDDEPLIIYVKLTMDQIIKLNEKTHILTTSFNLNLKWTDQRLMWNPSKYSNQLDRITAAASHFWLPDLVIMNSALESQEYFIQIVDNINSIITNDGSIFLSIKLPYQQTKCKINSFYYPFDTQICSIIIGSWFSSNNDINFHIFDPISNNCDNSIWKLNKISYKITNDSSRFGLFNEYNKINNENMSAQDVSFELVLKRNQIYFWFSFIIPCLFIDFSILMAIFMPFSFQLLICKSIFTAFILF